MVLFIILKVYEGGRLKLSRGFRSEQIRLGSGAADLILEGASVAPTHAIIDAGATGAVLRAASGAPLHLNGQPILAAPLRHGDLISVGELRVLVELRPPAVAAPPSEKRPRLQLIQGEEEPDSPRFHAPALAVVREEAPIPIAFAPFKGIPNPNSTPNPKSTPTSTATTTATSSPPECATRKEAQSDWGLNANATELAPLSLVQPAQRNPAALEGLPARKPAPVEGTALPPLRTHGLQGGDCVEVELFWGGTRLSVWQLAPGDRFVAGTASGCDALLEGIERAAVVRSDANGWVLCAPRPLSLTLVDDGRSLGGPELLVRGCSQADAHGLVMPLPARGVGMLSSGNLVLRVRRVPSAARVAPQRADWKGLFGASLAAVALVLLMRLLSEKLPPPRAPVEAEVIRPRPLVVRAAPKPADPLLQPDRSPKAQGRKDPGLAVARHEGPEGQAGSKNAPRRPARAERARDERAIVAGAGLLKALGPGKGASDVFGVALEKGVRDAIGHLTGPRAGDAQGGGLGLKSLGGNGGGGDGSGLGLARIDTNGIGGGLANYGEGKGGLRGKESAEIALGAGRPEVVGRIDPELIRKVVHEHRAQIRTCYEAQLNAKPNLAGKLVSAWTIDPSGVVTEAHTQESTLRDRLVESCVAAKVRTWRFPIPKGGGEVFVTYPFIFTAGG